MEEGGAKASGDCCYELCVVEWIVGDEANSARVYWDGSLLRTSYYASVDCRWLDDQNRARRVDWSGPEVESWFYDALLPVLGVEGETASRQLISAEESDAARSEQPQEADAAVGVGRSDADRNAPAAPRHWLLRLGKRKNAYDFVSGPTVAAKLEKTQINMFHTKGGTGFAAEEVNSLNDWFRGHAVEQVGRSNALNGADRIVDDVPIQTKYYDCAAKTMRAAFNSQGSYRYRGQLLEVPSDQYAECLGLMRERIEAGSVPGVTDPNEAEAIVKKGDVTYRQARNIARAGNIDGLVFDMKNQCVTSSYAFAVSFSINFAKMKWDGRDTEEALADSVSLAFQSGATSFVTGIATAQVLRSRAAAVGVVSMRNGVRAASSTKIGKAAVEKIAHASLGKAVYGAAAQNHVAKLLRTNVITSVVTTVVISSPDFYRAAFQKSISWRQFSKNLTVNGAGLAGGAGGWMAGAAIGTSLGSMTSIPFAKKACGFIGGITGAVGGGVAATWGSKRILDGLVEDDAKAMIRLLPDCLQPLATDYMLSESETDEFVDVLKNKVDAAFLRDMYRSTSRESFVYSTFEPACGAIIGRRPVITLPRPSEIQSLLAKYQAAVGSHLGMAGA